MAKIPWWALTASDIDVSELEELTDAIRQVIEARELEEEYELHDLETDELEQRLREIEDELDRRANEPEDMSEY